MQNENNYKRISCDLYDQLEIFATYKTKVRIKYVEPDTTQKEETCIIKTLETKDKSEYLITDKGTRIRLDRIVSMTEEK